MTMKHYWYSPKMHAELGKPNYIYNRSFSTDECDPVLEVGRVQALIDGNIATVCTDSRESSGCNWNDIVYIGEYDDSETRSVSATDFAIIEIENPLDRA